MKTLLIFASFLFVSLNIWAYQDGEYTCGNRDKFYETTYKVTTLKADGKHLPYLEITKKFFKNPAQPDSADKTYYIKGFATLFTTDLGQETLTIGSIALDLAENGRPSCLK